MKCAFIGWLALTAAFFFGYGLCIAVYVVAAALGKYIRPLEQPK